ncbi:tetratricopeptide repeat protein [Candidatus Sumerlaeota bacterium]|nr:tetratricopeptide repeat protein [Candidatus Sumerlaeota bacterium]
MDALFSLAFRALNFVPLVLSVVCLIDILRSDRPREWLFIVLLLPLIGPIVYLINFYMADRLGWRGMDVSIKRARRLKELKRLSLVQDTAGLWLEMGELHFQRKQWDEALEALRHAIDHDPELLKAQYYAGRALLETNRPRQAIVPLDYVVQQQGDYAFGEARIALARALEGDGQDAEALAQLDEVLKVNNYPEAVVRRAWVLKKLGRSDEAKGSLEKLVREEALFGRKDRRWVKAARKAAKA